MFAVDTETSGQEKGRHNPYAGLPRIVRFEYIEDSGAFGNARCPHCGAEGRYVYWFQCENDPELRGAMKGCLKHFPKHPFAQKAMEIADRRKDNLKKYDSTHLASWYEAIDDAIARFANGDIAEGTAWDIIHDQESRRRAYLQRRFGRR